MNLTVACQSALSDLRRTLAKLDAALNQQGGGGGGDFGDSLLPAADGSLGRLLGTARDANEQLQTALAWLTGGTDADMSTAGRAKALVASERGRRRVDGMGRSERDPFGCGEMSRERARKIAEEARDQMGAADLSLTGDPAGNYHVDGKMDRARVQRVMAEIQAATGAR